jgi:pre-rRNA-processing protein IPI3
VLFSMSFTHGLRRLLDNEQQNEVPAPYCSLSDHTLPISDICVGIGRFPSIRVITVSLDHTVKVLGQPGCGRDLRIDTSRQIWDLATCTLLTTLHFPAPIGHVTWDAAERAVFAASTLPIGDVYQANLYAPRESKLGVAAEIDDIQAVGGGGPGEVIRLDADSSAARRKRVFAVGYGRLLAHPLRQTDNSLALL